MSGVKAGAGGAKQRVCADCSVCSTAREAMKRVLPFRGCKVGIGAVWGRDDSFHFLRKDYESQAQCDKDC